MDKKEDAALDYINREFGYYLQDPEYWLSSYVEVCDSNRMKEHYHAFLAGYEAAMNLSLEPSEKKE